MSDISLSMTNLQKEERGTFRPMRRKKQELAKETCIEILRKGTSGVLALEGDGGYPYAVPLSYVYDGNKIYFHCARGGHKLDAIRRNPRASFCVIEQDEIVPEEYTTYFRSVIIFGTVRIMEEDDGMRNAIRKLAEKYAPDDEAANRQKAIDRDWGILCMLEMDIEHMSGKEAIELVKAKAAKAEVEAGE